MVTTDSLNHSINLNCCDDHKLTVTTTENSHTTMKTTTTTITTHIHITIRKTSATTAIKQGDYEIMLFLCEMEGFLVSNPI